MSRLLFRLFLILIGSSTLHAQSEPYNDKLEPILSLSEYLQLVYDFHPIAKQAELRANSAAANILKARGAFDPQLKASYSGKEFLGTDYFDILNTSLTIPTWYGIELKAGFDEADGVFLNPENFIPNNEQLFSAGISISVGEGLIIDKRRATLKQARLLATLTQNEQQLALNNLLTNAALSYFDWIKSYKQLTTYERFLKNAQLRFEGIREQVIVGDKAAIDSLEANITVQNRRLSLEQARLDYRNTQLAVSNFLWGNRGIPLELENNTIPQIDVSSELDLLLQLSNNLDADFTIENHPKINALRQKVDVLDVDRKFKADKLKPKLDLNYSFLNQDPTNLNQFNTSDFKAGFNFSLDIFLRKERGDLKLAKIKVEDAEYDYQQASLVLSNKIEASYNALQSFVKQTRVNSQIVADYNTLLKAEERKFEVGESSVFLINSRERSLIDTQLKQIEIENKLLKAKAKLFNTLGNDPFGT